MELLILFMINHVEHVETGRAAEARPPKKEFNNSILQLQLQTTTKIINSILQLQLVTPTKSPILLYNYDYNYDYRGRNKLRPSRSTHLHLYTAKQPSNYNYGGRNKLRSSQTAVSGEWCVANTKIK